MKYLVVRIGLLIAFSVSGCTWHSEAVDMNPFEYGSGSPVVQPSNWQAYSNGQEGLRIR
jgi:hypothetical protein